MSIYLLQIVNKRKSLKTLKITQNQSPGWKRLWQSNYNHRHYFKNKTDTPALPVTLNYGKSLALVIVKYMQQISMHHYSPAPSAPVVQGQKLKPQQEKLKPQYSFSK